jgi:hypothetical protein
MVDPVGVVLLPGFVQPAVDLFELLEGHTLRMEVGGHGHLDSPLEKVRTELSTPPAIRLRGRERITNGRGAVEIRNCSGPLSPQSTTWENTARNVGNST